MYVSKERNSHGCGGRGSLDCSFGNLDREVVKMKCDELKEVMNVMQVSGERKPSGYYKKTEVDAAIAELKEFAEDACLERDDNQTAIDELNEENRKLKRALWLARAERARSSALSYHLIESHPDRDMAATYKRKANKWEKAKDKCFNKAEEYK